MFHVHPGTAFGAGRDALLNEIHTLAAVIDIRINRVFLFELFATGSSVSFEVRDVLATVPKLPDAMKWAYPHLLQPTTITADIYGHLQESDVFGMRSEV